jgi:hypothetical protein
VYYEKILGMMVFEKGGVPSFTEIEMKPLVQSVTCKTRELVNISLNANNDSKIIRVVKLIRWMEDRLSKRKKVPTIETIGNGTFELNEYSEGDDSSAS